MNITMDTMNNYYMYLIAANTLLTWWFLIDIKKLMKNILEKMEK